MKNNNPQYYGDIKIDAHRLNQLPEDDVPEEILATICQSEKNKNNKDEAQGYVPVEDDFQTMESNDLDDDTGELKQRTTKTMYSCMCKNRFS